jgi:hypothetical protein
MGGRHDITVIPVSCDVGRRMRTASDHGTFRWNVHIGNCRQDLGELAGGQHQETVPAVHCNAIVRVLPQPPRPTLASCSACKCRSGTVLNHVQDVSIQHQVVVLTLSFN